MPIIYPQNGWGKPNTWLACQPTMLVARSAMLVAKDNAGGTLNCADGCEQLLLCCIEVSFLLKIKKIHTMIYQYQYYTPKMDGGSQIHGWLANRPARFFKKRGRAGSIQPASRAADGLQGETLE